MGGPREIEAFSNFPAYRATLLLVRWAQAKSALTFLHFATGQQMSLTTTGNAADKTLNRVALYLLLVLFLGSLWNKKIN